MGAKLHRVAGCSKLIQELAELTQPRRVVTQHPSIKMTRISDRQQEDLSDQHAAKRALKALQEEGERRGEVEPPILWRDMAVVVGKKDRPAWEVTR